MTRRTDDLPESWHNTYDDEPDRPHWLGVVFLIAAAFWIAVLFAAWFWGRV